MLWTRGTGVAVSCKRLCWGGPHPAPWQTPCPGAWLHLTRHSVVNALLSLPKDHADGAKYDYSAEYQQTPDLAGKGLCARALYDYQAGTGWGGSSETGGAGPRAGQGIARPPAELGKQGKGDGALPAS